VTEEGYSAESPLVSVVVAARNAAKTIDRTLKSIRAQRYPNLEVIVIDDGSSDDTAAIVARTASDDPRIRLIQKPWGGVASARNCGLRKARGKYLAPIDADDIWHPDNLTKQVGALEAARDAPFSFAASYHIDLEDNRIRDSLWKGRSPRADYIGLIRRYWVENGSAAVLNREAVVVAGGYDESKSTGEDSKLVLQLAARAPGIVVMEELVGYRRWPGTLTQNRLTAHLNTLETLEELQKEGPKIPPWHFWRAKTFHYVWLIDHLFDQGEWANGFAHFRKLAGANPLWFADRSTLKFLVLHFPRHLLRLFRRASPAV
jgi:glycosyltransferase involved in cell wall biosynthesis